MKIAAYKTVIALINMSPLLWEEKAKRTITYFDKIILHKMIKVQNKITAEMTNKDKCHKSW